MKEVEASDLYRYDHSTSKIHKSVVRSTWEKQIKTKPYSSTAGSPAKNEMGPIHVFMASSTVRAHVRTYDQQRFQSQRDGRSSPRALEPSRHFTCL